MGRSLLPTRFRFAETIAYIDGEDDDRSSWCRYINHADADSSACNCEARVDAPARRVWFEARRDIEVGEELCFCYR